MKKILPMILSLCVACSIALATQTSKPTTTGSANQSTTKKRGPVFRANKDQIKQAQMILKERGFYAGEQTGKLDPDTRTSLKKYQEAETLKITGTLNKVTLEKMGIVLTDKQKAM